MITINDAYDALLRSAGWMPPTDFEPIHTLLTQLIEISAPEAIIPSDTEGYIIEGAMQNGFEFIDDNADLMVVHVNDLIKYVKLYRDHSPAAKALRLLVSQLQEMQIEDPDVAMNGADTVDFLCQVYPGLKRAVT